VQASDLRPRRIVDLSLAIDEQTQVYPGDPLVRFETAATIADDGFNLLALHLGSQSGTNCDAPYHFRDDGAPIDAVDLALFAGPGVIVDVRGKAQRAVIGVADVEPYLGRVGEGTIVVLHTGWPKLYGTAAYFDHPYLDVDAARELLDRGTRTICLDTPNIDETPDDAHPGAGFPVHKLIAAAGGVIVENLTNLDLIDFPDPLISVLPLKLTGADGAPTRAVAIEFGPA
jgi:kynurenine formamidase